MTATTLEKPQQEAAPLYINRAALEFPETPFAHDVLNRKKLADQLTSYINRLSKGHTIGVDGDWGSGKTTFGKNWYMQLRTEGYPVVWLDAFAVDYCEDPFLPIANELRKLTAGSSHNAGVVENTKSIGKALIPAFGSALVHTAVKWTVGEAAGEQLGDAFAESMGQLAEKQLEEKMRSFDQQCSSVAHLKRALTDFAASKSKPLVFFIDELDRCRPDFAVKLLERIKHFFETENVVFVLLINHQQLAASVQGLYGGHIDGSTYLNKFIHFEMQLPSISQLMPSTVAYARSNTFKNITQALSHDLGVQANSSFSDGLFIANLCYKLSLRDIKHALINFQLLTAGNQPKAFYGIYGWLIGMKIAALDEFKACKSNVREAHDICIQNLKEAGKFDREEKIRELRDTLIALHQTQLTSHSENQKIICNQIIKDAHFDDMGDMQLHNDSPNMLLHIIMDKLAPNIPLRG